jgi:uncharacterized ParB-like nuclease family protein
MSIFTTAPNLSDLESMWEASTTNEVLAIEDVDDTMQMRVKGTDAERVDDYTAKLENGVTFPPLDIFVLESPLEGEVFVLANGYHRLYAMQKASFDTVEARVFRGRSWDEARLYAAFANARNGKESSNEDIDKAIGMLLSVAGAKDRFVINNKLDTKSIAKWVGVTKRTVEQLTGDLREHIETVRDTAIAIGKEEGLSNRAIAEEVGCDHKTVGKVVTGEKANASQNPHEEPNATKPPPSLFNSLDIKSKLGDDVEIPEDFLFDEEEIHDTLENGEYKEKKAALAKANEAGFTTIANSMAKADKKKPVVKKLTRTERSANAIGSLVSNIQSLEEVNPDLAELTTYIQNDPTVLNDLVVAADYIKRLTNSLDTENLCTSKAV